MHDAILKKTISNKEMHKPIMNTTVNYPLFSGEKLSKNLKTLMEKSHVSMTELGKQTGIPLTTLKRIKMNDDANPTLTTLVPIANFFSITLNQLAGIDPLPKTNLMGQYAHKRDYWTDIPVLTWTQAIDWNTNRLSHNNLSNNIEKISTDIRLGKNAFALRVENDDWINFLKGSLLIIDPTLTPENRDYVIAHKKGQATVNFRELLIDEGNRYLKPLNREFKTVQMDEHYTIKGIMVQVRADFKS